MELLDQDTIEKEDGLNVRRPRTPFPFWGPFDPVNAIGRSILLISMFGLACIFMIVTIGSRDYYFGHGDKYFSKLIFILVTTVFLMLGMGSGIGILQRSRWAVKSFKLQTIVFFIGIVITIIRGDIFWLLFTIDLLDSSTLSAKVRYFFTFLPGLVGILTFLASIPVIILISMKKPAVSYQFEHITLSRLENGMWESTKSFGILWVLIGSSVLLAGAINFIMTLSFLTRHELRYVYLLADMLNIIVVIYFIFGAILLFGGILFLLHYNAGRIIIIFYLFVFWLLSIARFYGDIVRSPFHRESITFESPFESTLIYSVKTFGLFVFTYVLMEIKRYLSSPKVVAWCRKGYYMPAWKKQIEDYEKLKTGEELRKETRGKGEEGK